MDIHNVDHQLEMEHRRLDRMNDENAEVIKDFERYCRIRGLRKPTLIRKLAALRKVSGWLDKAFGEATKDDVERILSTVEDQDYSQWTKRDYRSIVKQFFTWLEKPEIVEWVTTTIPRSNSKLPEQLLTWPEIIKMVEAATNIRNKALLMTLAESGGRISEIANMRIKHVEPKENYVVIRISGKTGPRQNILVSAMPYLCNWLDNHPLKHDEEAPLWVNLGNVRHLKQMTYSNISKILKRMARKARIKKDVHPHLLRHSRASELANELTESQLNEVFGWKQGSRMPSIYVHLSGKNIKDALLRLYGLKEDEETRKAEIIKKCTRCGTINQFESKFCSKCGLIMNVREAFEKEKEKQQELETIREALHIIKLLRTSPELKEILERLKPSL